MTNSSAEFRKIWIEQCAATEDIREHFGLKNALEYLIGEKLFTFVTASDQDPDFAAEFRRLSPQSGGCLPLVRFANISTTWSRRSFWPAVGRPNAGAPLPPVHGDSPYSDK